MHGDVGAWQVRIKVAEVVDVIAQLSTRKLSWPDVQKRYVEQVEPLSAPSKRCPATCLPPTLPHPLIAFPSHPALPSQLSGPTPSLSPPP